MGGINQRGLAFFLVVLLSMTLPVTAQSNASNEALVDGRIVQISLDNTAPYQNDISVQAGTYVSLTVACDSCSVTLQSDTGSLSNGLRIMHFTENDTSLNMSISSETAQDAAYFLRTNISDNFPTLRPSPSTQVTYTTTAACTLAADCMDVLRGSLASYPPTELVESAIHSGVIESEHDEFIAIEMTEGQTLEWQWLDLHKATSVEMYFQNQESEILLNGSLSGEQGYTELTTYISGQESTLSEPLAQWWVAPTDGRIVARISSEISPTVWSAMLMTYDAQPSTSLIGQDLLYGTTLLGHSATISPFDWNDTRSMDLHSRLGSVTLRVDQLLNGNWIEGELRTLEKGESIRAFPYPGIVGGRLVVSDSPAFSVEFLMHEFTDAGSGIEAPSSRLMDLNQSNASWPLASINSSTRGELTLAVHDTSDTYRISVPGWEDSVHFIQFEIIGNVSNLEAVLWDIDQTTSEPLSTAPSVLTSDGIRVSGQVGRGTHFLQIRLINSSMGTQHLWGENVPPLEYTINPAYQLIDEGDEPWFPPSDEAVKWGEIARWFLGGLFLLPVAFVLISARRNRNYGLELLAMKERLAWYKERLDSGELNVHATQRDLVRALHAVAQLEWEDGVSAWGTPALKHRTEGLDIAVWHLDSRMAKTPSAWPLVIGLHVIEGDWDLAALRFDAPEGQPLTVTHVEPRFLFQGEEVFLDTLKKGHRTFLTVELSGDNSIVDIELNGRMDTRPFAAKIPMSLSRSEEE